MVKRNTNHVYTSYRTYIFTWAALLILLTASITAVKMQMGSLSILISLFIASVKACLILYFFMHLRYENWFLKLTFLLPITVFIFFMGLTFLDVFYR